jgi:hypothetical protein
MERRGSIRYPLRLPVWIVAVGAEPVHIPAHTFNISCAGVLLECSQEFAVGQRIEYIIDLYSDNNLRLRCRGKAERSVKDTPSRPGEDGAYMVALTLETFEFVRRSNHSTEQ